MADPDRLSQQSISEQLASQASASQEPLSQQSLLIETGMQTARSSVKDRADIRAQARDLTVQALRDRRFEPQAFRDVLRAVTEGVRRAAEQRPHGVRSAISDALTGLDGAMMKAAEAASLALRELTAQGKEFSDTEIKPVQESIKKIEADFLDTAPHAAEHESVIVRKEMLDALSHLTRTGTDTGAEVAATLNEFAGRMTRISIENAKLGLEAASDFRAR